MVLVSTGTNNPVHDSVLIVLLLCLGTLQTAQRHILFSMFTVPADFDHLLLYSGLVQFLRLASSSNRDERPISRHKRPFRDAMTWPWEMLDCGSALKSGVPYFRLGQITDRLWEIKQNQPPSKTLRKQINQNIQNPEHMKEIIHNFGARRFPMISDDSGSESFLISSTTTNAIPDSNHEPSPLKLEKCVVNFGVHVIVHEVHHPSRTEILTGNNQKCRYIVSLVRRMHPAVWYHFESLNKTILPTYLACEIAPYLWH